MSKHEIGAGDVKVELAGHGEVILHPSLKACTVLTGMPGGVIKLQERVMHMEFSAIKMVVEAGLGKTAKEMDDIIFRTGLFDLRGPCISFLSIVANGGRPLGETEEEETDPLAGSESLSLSTTES